MSKHNEDELVTTNSYHSKIIQKSMHEDTDKHEALDNKYSIFMTQGAPSAFRLYIWHSYQAKSIQKLKIMT